VPCPAHRETIGGLATSDQARVSAVVCFVDVFEAGIPHLRFSLNHRKPTCATNARGRRSATRLS